jgi:aryl sulfotransferase
MTATELPHRGHIYQNHHLDSTYWDGFTPRNDDVVIATSIKGGTTWMQNIVANLIFQGQEPPGQVWQLSPWIDFRSADIREKLAFIEAQTHRRFVKSHLPLDGLIYFPEVKYIYVGRDARDVFMSLWNHYNAFSPEMFEWVNNFPGRVGDPFPPAPDDIHQFFHAWVTKGWFSWEREGYPYWSVLRHGQSWFTYHHLPNILLVHFNDLLGDLDGEMRRIARYLDVEINEDIWSTLVDNATFKTMKRNAEQVVPGGGGPFVGGAERFLFKGTNGRWMSVLSADELALYEKTVAEVMTPDCARWLEQGRAALQ